ncbi:Uncharacterized protein TCM_031053 [Theobroma cacao]|uniref:Uncharacterized protein n=1 Tax=Theobroma cacao TaxID=3641 RepID=A0A061F667_THECC|nr:Uncharacterized protein TCM_031053 [Theobroma cacao]
MEKCPNLTSMLLFPSLHQDLTLIDTSTRPLQQTLKLKMKMTEASMTSEEASSSSSGSTCPSYYSTALPLCNLKCLTLMKIHDLEAVRRVPTKSHFSCTLNIERLA